MKIKSLVQDTMLYGLSSGITRALMLILIPIFISALTVDQFGLISLFQFYLGAGIILFLFGLDHALFREFPGAGNDIRQTLLSTCTLFLIGVALLSAVGFLVFRNWLVSVLFRQVRFSGIMFWLWIIMVAESATLIQSVIFRAQKKAGIYFRNTLIKYGSLLIFSWILLKPVHAGLNGVFLAYLISNLLYTLFSIRIWKSYFRLRFSSTLLRNLLQYGLPLLPAGLLNLFLFFADHYLIQRMLNLEAVGLYAFGYKFGAVIYYLIGALNNAWYPRLFAMDRPSLEDHYHRLLISVAWISMAAFLIVDSVFRFFHPWFVPGTYVHSVRIVSLVGLAYIVHNIASFADCLFFYVKKVRIIPMITGISLVVNLCLNCMLIPHFGITGAALATLAAFALYLVLVLTFLKKLDLFTLHFGETGSLMAGFSLLYAASCLVTPDSFCARIGLATSLFLLFLLLSWILSPTLRTLFTSAPERIKKQRNP